MKSTLRLVPVLVLSLLVCACPDGSPSNRADVTWARSFGGPVWDEAAAAIPTSDGGYLFAGTRGAQYDTRDPLDEDQVDGEVWVAKLDGAGNPKWELTYGEPFLSPAGNRVIYTQAADAGGGETWVAGIETASEMPTGDPLADGGNLVIGRVNASGDVLFRRIHDSGEFPSFSFTSLFGTVHEKLYAIAATSDGGLLAACWLSARVDKPVEMRSGVEVNAIWVLKLDSNGDPIWDTHLRRRADGVIHDRFFPYHPGATIDIGLFASDDGGGLVTAYSSAEPDTELIRLQSNGTIRWSRARVDGHVRASAPIDADGDGLHDDGCVLAGIDQPHDDKRGFLVRLDAGGNPVWGRTDEGVRGFEGVTQGQYIDVNGLQVPAVAAVGVRGSEEGRILFVSLDGSNDAAIDPYVVDEAPEIRYDLDRWRVLGIAGGAAFVNSFGRDQGSLGAQLLDRIPQVATAELLLDGSVLDIRKAFNPTRVVLTRMAPSGDIVLEREFPARGTFVERAHALVELEGFETRYAVLAETGSFGSDFPEPWLLILDDEGEILRQIILEDAFLTLDRPSERFAVLTATGDGGLAVAVRVAGHARLVRFDSAGEELWNSPPLSPVQAVGFLGFLRESCKGVAETADGGFVVVGALEGPGAWAARLDAAGAVVWRREFGPSSGRRLEITDVIVMEGGFALGGIHDGEPFVMRIDDAGGFERASFFPLGGAAAGRVTRLAPADDGGLLVATSWVDSDVPLDEIGDGAASTGRINVLLLRIDDELEPSWYRVYGGLYDEVLAGLEAVPEGGWLVAARSDSLGDRGEAWLLRVDYEGLITEGCNAYLQGGDWPAVPVPISMAQSAYVPDVDPGELEPAVLSLVDTPAIAQFPPQAVVARQCVGFSPVGRPEDPPPGDGSFTLTVVFEGGGTGAVRSEPAGIDCRATCSAVFAAGTEVFLSPIVDEGSVFSHWDDCDQDFGAEGCGVVMSADRTVTVYFE